jgi:hypothetical protein
MADKNKDIHTEDHDNKKDNHNEEVLLETKLVGAEKTATQDEKDDAKVYVEEQKIEDKSHPEEKIPESKQVFIEEDNHEEKHGDEKLNQHEEPNQIEALSEEVSQELNADSQLEEEESDILTKEADEIHISKEESNISPEEAKKIEFLKELEEISGAMEEQKKAGNHLNKKEPVNPTKEQIEENEKHINEAFTIYHKGIEVAIPYFNDIETKQIDKNIPAVAGFINSLKLLYSNSALALQKLKKYIQCIEYDNYVILINLDNRKI